MSNVACFRHWRELPLSLRSKISRTRRICGDGHPNTLSVLAKAERVWLGLPHVPDITAPGRAS